MPTFFDTHAHLFDDRFAADRPTVLARATAAGVERMVAVGIDLASSRTSVMQAAGDPRLIAAVGLQPNSASEAAPADWDAIVALAEAHPVAIGETGLDRYWDRTPFAMQEDYFARHLALARRLDRAVIIHCREAEADVVRMLTEDFNLHGPVRAMLHSFTGDAGTAAACLAMGLYVSFAGMITYKNADALRAVARTIPLDRLLIETDCPYLAPVPVRGQRNEPAYVAHTATALAAARGEILAELAAATTRNARALFLGDPERA